MQRNCSRIILCQILSILGRHLTTVLSGLWPFWFVAVSVCGHFGLWPFRSVAISVCGHFGLWPFRFLAVSEYDVFAKKHYGAELILISKGHVITQEIWRQFRSNPCTCGRLMMSTGHIQITLCLQYLHPMGNKCIDVMDSGHNGHKPKRPKPKRPQTERATNRNGHRPERPQTETATSQNGHRPERPQTETAANRNGH